MPHAHIYPLSRLVHASPGTWEQLLASIEGRKRIAFTYYLPMREAVVLFCAKEGRNREQIFRQMIARASAIGGPRSSRLVKDNARAFATFETVFFPMIRRFRRDLLRHQRPECEFGGLTLQGGPHFEAIDQEGRKRHVFLHASNWAKEDLAAYLELLAVIIESCYGGDSSSLWILDLRHGKVKKWRPSARVRNRCRAAAKLYARLIGAMENSEDTDSG